MREHPTVVLLASGGLDSTTLAYWLIAQGITPQPLFIDYGQHCAETEFETVQSVLDPKVFPDICRVDVSSIYRSSSSRLIDEPDLWTESVSYEEMYLPYRTLLLLSVGAAYAQSNGFRRVYSAFINSNHAQEIDCSSAFFDSLSDVLKGFGGIEMHMPFRRMDKIEVAKLGVELQAPIGFTYSCQASSDVACGACPNCVDRLEALDAIVAVGHV